MATLMKGVLKEDLEYAKYNVSSNIDLKNLHENYLNALSILDEIPDIIELPSNEINHKLIHEAPGLLDYYKKTLGLDPLLIPEKDAYSFKGDLLQNGVDLSYRDDLLVYQQLPEQEYFDEFNKYANRIINFADKYAIDLNKWKELPIYQEHKLSVFATANSNVLLKNENHILPLKYESILLLGKAQDHPLSKGLYSERDFVKQPSIEALMKNYSKDVRYIELYNSHMEVYKDQAKKCLEMAKHQEKVVLVVSNPDYYVREGIDRNSLKLSDSLNSFFEELIQVNPNVIVVMETIGKISFGSLNRARGILLTYPSGEGMNEGIIMSLYGVIPPSGRLPETFADDYEDYLEAISHDNDVFDRLHTESIYNGYKFYDMANEDVRYPFGYGLSYSSFEVKKFTVSEKKDELKFTVVVKNTGEYDSMVPVQIYFSMPRSKTFRAKKKFIGFDKKFIKKHESETFVIYVKKCLLNVYDMNKKKLMFEPGEYDFQVFLSTHKEEASTSLTFKGKAYIEDDLRFSSKSYFVYNDQSFTPPVFEKIYRMPFVEEDATFSPNILSKDADNYTGIMDVYKHFRGMIDRAGISESDKYIYRKYLHTYPVRLLYKYIPLITKEEVEKIITDILQE